MANTMPSFLPILLYYKGQQNHVSPHCPNNAELVVTQDSFNHLYFEYTVLHGRVYKKNMDATCLNKRKLMS